MINIGHTNSMDEYISRSWAVLFDPLMSNSFALMKGEISSYVVTKQEAKGRIIFAKIR